jgi:hypothetical protein
VKLARPVVEHVPKAWPTGRTPALGAHLARF